MVGYNLELPVDHTTGICSKLNCLSLQKLNCDWVFHTLCPCVFLVLADNFIDTGLIFGNFHSFFTPNWPLNFKTPVA